MRKSFCKFYFSNRGNALTLLFLVLLQSRVRSSKPLLWKGLIFVFLAMGIRLGAGWSIGKWSSSKKMEAPHLSKTGIYLLSRNPLYLANIFGALGLITFSNSISKLQVLFLNGLVFLHHRFLIHEEECYLMQAFRTEYFDYLQAVPRWICIKRLGKFLFLSPFKISPLQLQQAWSHQSKNIFHLLISVLLLALARVWNKQ